MVRGTGSEGIPRDAPTQIPVRAPGSIGRLAGGKLEGCGEHAGLATVPAAL